MPSSNWLDRDIESPGWQRELQHLKRRARARIWTVFAGALLGTALVTAMAARRQPLHVSTVIVRVTEGGVMQEKSPLAAKNLGGYISDSVLSTRNLIGLIERFDLYPLARLRGERIAVATLRDFLDIEVFRNYFLGAARGRTSERSARIAITFLDPNPIRSFAVARAVADLIVTTETARRSAYSADDVAVAQQTVDQATAVMAARQGELAGVEVELDRARRRKDAAEIATYTVASQTLRGQIEAQSLILADTVARLDELRLLSAINSSDLGLSYAVVDERPPPPRLGGPQKLISTALVAFLILLPLCGVAIGAFDTRVHDAEDIERLGLTVVGHVPRFAGHRVGGLDERRRRQLRRSQASSGSREKS